MSSHRALMQYEHNRRTGTSRADSASSLRAGEQSSIGQLTAQDPQQPSYSNLSGSYRSRVNDSRSRGGGLYVNASDSGRHPLASSFDNASGSLRSDHTASVTSYQPSTAMGRSTLGGPRSGLTGSHYKLSRSLRASKASLASYRSGRSTIQVENHDRKVQRQIASVKFGRARKLYWVAVFFFLFFLLVLFLGLLVMCLNLIYMNISLSLDLGTMIGPLLISGSFLFFGLSIKFYYDAYRLSCEERSHIKYKAASPSTVEAKTVTKRPVDPDQSLSMSFVQATHVGS